MHNLLVCFSSNVFLQTSSDTAVCIVSVLCFWQYGGTIYNQDGTVECNVNNTFSSDGNIPAWLCVAPSVAPSQQPSVLPSSNSSSAPSLEPSISPSVGPSTAQDMQHFIFSVVYFLYYPAEVLNNRALQFLAWHLLVWHHSKM